MLRESLFNITRGDEDIAEGGSPKFLDTRKGASEKIVGLGGGVPKICILQNQQEEGGGVLKIEPPLPLVILNELSLTYAFAVKRN